jgi:hypothetical protein
LAGRRAISCGVLALLAGWRWTPNPAFIAQMFQNLIFSECLLEIRNVFNIHFPEIRLAFANGCVNEPVRLFHTAERQSDIFFLYLPFGESVF